MGLKRHVRARTAGPAPVVVVLADVVVAQDPVPGRVAMLSAFSSRNYRLYFGGQALSQAGTWMQTVGQAWLVLRLTGSGADLGLVLAAQFLPVLVLGPAGGALVDRLDKRSVLIVTQGSAALFALSLGLLDVTHVVRLWMVFVLAAGLGGVNIADSPARQSFVTEMVGADMMPNAVALNTTLINAARIVGPALAAACIALFGTGWCFIVNGVSFTAVVGALVAMDPSTLHRLERRDREKGAVRAGFAYVAGDPVLRSTLIMLAIIGLLASEFPVTLPLVAARTFHGSSSLYALLTAAMGVGAVGGGLFVAGRSIGSPRLLAAWCAAFALALAGAATAPDLAFELVLLVAAGATSVVFTARANSTLQLNSRPNMRGRVMSLWAVALLGTSPIGGPLVGWVADRLGARWGLGVGAAGCAAAAIVGWATASSARREMTTESPPLVQIADTSFPHRPNQSRNVRSTMEFGVFIPIANNGWIMSSTSPQYMPSFELNREVVQRAEHYGFGFALSMVKFRGYGGATRYWDYALESFTLMSALAAVTSEINLFASVATVSLHPAIVARMAATIDDVAPGRFGVNIVAGWNKSEYAQMGIWPGDEFYEYRYEYAEEYVSILRQLWSEGRSDFKGRFFDLDDCRCLPMPRGDIKIVCAGASPRGRRFTAEYGDYNFTGAPGGPAGLAEVNQALAAETERSGRDVSSYPVYMVIIDDTDELARKRVETYNAGADLEAIAFMRGQASLDVRSEGTSAKMVRATPAAMGSVPIAGSPATVAREIDALAAVAGTGGIMLTFDDFVEGVERFGSEVMPLLACRQAVTA